MKEVVVFCQSVRHKYEGSRRFFQSVRRKYEGSRRCLSVSYIDELLHEKNANMKSSLFISQLDRCCFIEKNSNMKKVAVVCQSVR